MSEDSLLKQKVKSALQSLDKNDPMYTDKANKVMNYYMEKAKGGASTIGVDADTLNTYKEKMAKMQELVSGYGKVTGTAKDMTVPDMKEAQDIIGITTPSSPGVGKGLKLASEAQDVVKPGVRTSLMNVANKVETNPELSLKDKMAELASKMSSPRGAKIGEDVTSNLAKREAMNTAINSEKAGLTKYLGRGVGKAAGALGIGALYALGTGDASAALPPEAEAFIPSDSGPQEGSLEHSFESGKIDAAKLQEMQDPNSQYNQLKNANDEDMRKQTMDVRRQAIMELGTKPEKKADGGTVKSIRKEALRNIKKKR